MSEQRDHDEHIRIWVQALPHNGGNGKEELGSVNAGGGLPEQARTTVEQLAGVPPSGETLVPGSLPFPTTGDGESIGKDRAVQA